MAGLLSREGRTVNLRAGERFPVTVTHILATANGSGVISTGSSRGRILSAATLSSASRSCPLGTTSSPTRRCPSSAFGGMRCMPAYLPMRGRPGFAGRETLVFRIRSGLAFPSSIQHHYSNGIRNEPAWSRTVHYRFWSLILIMDYFFVDPDDVVENHLAIKGDEYRHLSRVLRKKAGDHVMVTDGRGRMYEAIIHSLSRTNAECAVLHTFERLNEPKINVTLAISPLKNPARLDFVVEKATELGRTQVNTHDT